MNFPGQSESAFCRKVYDEGFNCGSPLKAFINTGKEN
jgi:hypothetical protein